MGKDRKILLLIMEGETDETALSKPIECLINSFDLGVKVRCRVYRSDITISDLKNSNENFSFADSSKVEKRIIECVNKYLVKNPQFDVSDILAVCSFHDLDACYCNDENIKPSLGENLYDLLNHIHYCKNILFTKERNIIKRDALAYLFELQKIHVKNTSIPYQAYFYSINLEHILIDNPNIVHKNDKIKISQDFRLRFHENPVAFTSFLQSINKYPNGHVVSYNEKLLFKYPFYKCSNLLNILSFVFERERKVFHPGEYIQAYLTLTKTSIDEFSNKSNIQINILEALIKKEVNIDGDLAIKLAKATGLYETTWNNIQSKYDKQLAFNDRKEEEIYK